MSRPVVKDRTEMISARITFKAKRALDLLLAKRLQEQGGPATRTEIIESAILDAAKKANIETG